MKTRILKKENGVTTEYEFENTIKEPYIVNEDNCFSKVISNDVSLSNKKQIKNVKGAVVEIIKVVTAESPGTIYSLYCDLAKADTKEKLFSVVKKLDDKFDEIFTSKRNYDAPSKRKYYDLRKKYGFKELLETNPELVMSITAKQITYEFLVQSLVALGFDKVNKLQNQGFDQILIIMGQPFDENNKDNGLQNLVRRMLPCAIQDAIRKTQVHLCWQNCKNATAVDCRRIYEGLNHTIDEYDYITDGYQSYNEKGELKHYVITGCNQYEKANNKTLTRDQKRHIKAVKVSLLTAYFDAETVDEAYIIQHDLETRGELSHIRGTHPGEKLIKVIKSRYQKKR